MNWISRIIGETTTAGAIPMAGPGSGAGGTAVKRFKKPLKKRPMTAIEAIIGDRTKKPVVETDRPKDPVSPTPERKSPEPDPTPKAAEAPPSVGDEEVKPQPIIPPTAQKLNNDGSEAGAETKDLTRADRAVLDLFMPKREQQPTAPQIPGMTEADAFRMLGLQPGGQPAGPTSIPSGPMPEHAPSPDGAEKLLEVMHRFLPR